MVASLELFGAFQFGEGHRFLGLVLESEDPPGLASITDFGG